ncbi:hypothetical protein [Frankia sp. AgKG'84/4]|uniref:arsenate reductase/protein-tyrosine-phosphatase family protein n=1 Tax=Frankia sp. AgKG'84/4 TaxID=573490 RepID=UPI0027E5464F|nr:hypothetical protein [Frankia sp. AgKG'84/4]
MMRHSSTSPARPLPASALDPVMIVQQPSSGRRRAPAETRLAPDAPSHPTPPGPDAIRPPEVLFVCAHDAGRSQMGAALLDHHSRGRIQARSAGTAPAPAVASPIVAAMAEIGIDLSEASPTRLTDDAVRAASVVICMDGGDTVPFYPHTRYLSWELADPAEQPLEVVRPIRDEIDARVRALVYRLGVAARVGLLGRQADGDRAPASTVPPSAPAPRAYRS